MMKEGFRRRFKGQNYIWTGGFGSLATRQWRAKSKMGQMFEKGVYRRGGSILPLTIAHIRVMEAQGWIKKE